jgi:predicted NBD/HSP70 family sugar kinase
VLKLIWGGRIPVKTLFSVHSLHAERMARVLARDEARLPPRPKAIAVERDEAAMNLFLDAALVDLKAVGAGQPVPGAVDRLDVEKPPPRPLALFTRLAGTVSSTSDYIRALDRTRNTPG